MEKMTLQVSGYRTTQWAEENQYPDSSTKVLSTSSVIIFNFSCSKTSWSSNWSTCREKVHEAV